MAMPIQGAGTVMNLHEVRDERGQGVASLSVVG
jgi:hypothetical protein